MASGARAGGARSAAEDADSLTRGKTSVRLSPEPPTMLRFPGFSYHVHGWHQFWERGDRQGIVRGLRLIKLEGVWFLMGLKGTR